MAKAKKGRKAAKAKRKVASRPAKGRNTRAARRVAA